MTALQRTGLGNLKGKHIATLEKLHFCTETHFRNVETHVEKRHHLWLTSLLAVVFADQKPWIAPLYVEVGVDRDAEVFV